MDLDHDILLQTFIEETQENLVAMEQALVALEARPGDDEAIRAVFRGAHTIKGNAATLGFRAVADFAHAFEDVLARLRARSLAPSAALTSLLLRALDALREGIALAAGGAEALPTESESVRQALEKYAADGGEAAAPEGNAPTFPDESPHLSEARGLEGRTLRVDVGRLDRMLRLAGEIAISRGRLREMLDRGQSSRDALETHREADRLFLELQEQIMEARLVPLGPVFRRHQRTVRDVALAVGKEVQLVVEGDEVEVDMTVVEHMRDPLTHMIRNAIDHGIETPDVRARRGKDARGRITLRARRDSGSIVMEIEDDGAGLDLPRIREVGAARGFDTARMRDAELGNLIFASGFSTAAAVTDLSGRGVGMEVVRRNVDLLRGTIAVETRPERGTTISIRVPLTLAIIDGFQVQVGAGAGAETYVVPLDTVVECMELPLGTGDRADECGVIDVRGEAVPFVRLGGVFSLGGDAPAPQARENVVVVKHEERLTGIAVDALLGQSQTVIKPLSKMFRGLPGVAGSTILGNGRVALILDVPALMREVTLRQSQRQVSDARDQAAPASSEAAS
jgi:two-component system chemotaxis sensor kinase CheA